MDVVLGPWFGQLLAGSAAPSLFARVVKSLGVSPSGKGLVPISELIARAVRLANSGIPEIEPWCTGYADVARSVAALQIEHAALRDLGHVDAKQHRVYAALTRIARSGSSCSSLVLKALGVLLLEAAWDARSLEAQWIEMLATLANVDGRTQSDPSWMALRQLPSLDSDALLAALARSEIIGQAATLARRLLRSLDRVRSPGVLPFEGACDGASNALANAGREASPPAPDAQQQPYTKAGPTTRKDARGKVPKRPSFIRLTSAARYQMALDALGVPEVWHRFRLSELAGVTRRLAADLHIIGSPDVVAYAACCITALLVNHDHRATLELSLIDNGDLWLSVHDRVLVVAICSRRRKRKAVQSSGSSPCNRIYIAIPQGLALYLAACMSERPGARTLRELLGVELVDEWLARCEAYLIPLGDAAHPARSARVSHSLGTAYLECGASPELAAGLGIAPVLCAESSPYYVAIEFAIAKEVTARVYDALGLGEAAQTKDFGRMGSTRALSDDRVRDVWASLGNAYLAELDAVRGAPDVSAVAEAYTRGSAACFLAESWCTAARGQRSDQATHQDLRSYSTAVYRDDKETRPEGSRLVPRLQELDQVICAQLALSQATADRLRALGIADDAIPTPLTRPRGRDPLFGRLRASGDAAGNALVEWASLNGPDVASAVIKCGCGHRNAARHTWASSIHSSGAGMWALRTLLGHGRGAAAPGSFYTTWAPSALLDDLAARMNAVMDRWALPPFGGLEDALTELLPVQLQLDWLDKPAKHQYRGMPPLYQHMPRHYCTADSLPALRVFDEICAELHDAGEFGHSGVVLVSLVCMDGVTDPADLRAIWSTLLTRAVSSDSGLHEWRRQGAKVIRMPSQPSTRLRLNAASNLESFETAAEQVLARLRAKFALVSWPKTIDGILGALCWLACRWVRVHMPPLLVYCYDARTRAATYTDRSFERLQRPVNASALSIEALRRAVEPRAPRRSLDEELKLLRATVRDIAHDDANIGDDLLRSQLIAQNLNERFDRLNCSPFTAMLLDWIGEEFKRWTRRDTDPLQMSPIYEYLRLIVRSVGRKHTEWHPQDWTAGTWRRFGLFVLDVTKVEEEGQVSESRRAGEIRERRKAWRRLIRVLTDSGRYMAARGAMPSDDKEDDGPAPVASASSIYCDSVHLALGERIVCVLFAESPLERDILIAMLHAGFELMGRADECNAIRSRDVGPDFVALCGEGFSTEKTDGSRRVPPSSPEFGRLLRALRDVLSTLRPPPTHLFAQSADEIRLRHGRQREGVLVQIMRAVLDDPDFHWHCFRGMGLMRRTAPDTEDSLRAILGPTFPLHAARAIVVALRGEDPRHLGRVFGASGHASYLSPGQSYLAAWPLWYAAVMRAARGDGALNQRLLVQSRGRTYASAHRQRRRRSTQRDEWAWVLSPGDQRTNESRPAVVAPASSVPCDLPAELKALAVRAGATWATRLRFAIEVLLGLPPEPRAWRSNIGDTAARGVIERLRPIPALRTFHHATPGRPDDLARQRFTVADLLKDPRASELVTALEITSAASVRALDRLLADDLRSFEVQLVEQALLALPSGWKLELCWPRGQLDREILVRLTHLRRRLSGLCCRVHVVRGVRTRVVPASGVNHTSMTNLTTLTRTAVRAWLLISTMAAEE